MPRRPWKILLVEAPNKRTEESQVLEIDLSHKYVSFLGGLIPTEGACGYRYHVQGFTSSFILDKLYRYDFLMATFR